MRDGESIPRRRRQQGEIARVRLQDVAAEAGVSMITVSRCLHRPGRVSAETREHVLAVARKLNYITNQLASSLASTRTKTVAVIIPTISNPIHSETLQGITDVLNPAGYRILLGSHGYSMESEEKIVQVFLGYQVDGIVLTGVTHTAECISLIRRSGTPVVETLDLCPDPVDMVVGFSNFEAGRGITHHLLGRGHRRIAFVGHAATQDTRAAGRQAGFLAAMAEQSDVPPLIVSLPSTSDEQGARAALEQILARAPDTDAILFVGHLLGAAAIRHAHDIGVAVPGRLAIAAMGDSPISSWTTPSLTTVHFPLRDIGVNAAQMLLGRFRGEAQSRNIVDLGYSIVERESA